MNRSTGSPAGTQTVSASVASPAHIPLTSVPFSVWTDTATTDAPVARRSTEVQWSTSASGAESSSPVRASSTARVSSSVLGTIDGAPV